jgi:hypothetical protein
MLNTGVRVQTKSGDSIYSTNSLGGFWLHPDVIATNAGNPALIADPRTAFDPFHNRWIASAVVDGYSLTTSGIMIAVSAADSPHPTNGWHSLRVDVDSNNLLTVDRPTLGFNKDWIVVQGNMFDSEGIQASHIWVFNKTNLYAGGSDFTLLVHDDPDGAGNELPAITYDNNLDKLYLV